MFDFKKSEVNVALTQVHFMELSFMYTDWKCKNTKDDVDEDCDNHFQSLGNMDKIL